MIFHIFFIIILINGAIIIVYEGYAAVHGRTGFFNQIVVQGAITQIGGSAVLKVPVFIQMLCVSGGHHKNTDVGPCVFNIVEGCPKPSRKGSDIVRVVGVVGGSPHIVIRAVIHDQNDVHLVHIHSFHYLYGFRISGVGFVRSDRRNSGKFIVAETFHHIIKVKMVFGIFGVVHGVFTGCRGVRESAVIYVSPGFGGNRGSQSGIPPVIREGIVPQT